MISYESSKWYIKIWRHRWYIYATVLYLEKILKIGLLTDYIIDAEIGDSEKEQLSSDWKLIKKHVELSKMCKFSTK